MTNMPIYGCVGCSGSGGRLSCPEHGFYEVVERDAVIARLQAEAEVTTREAITVRTRLYEAVAEVERLTREAKEDDKMYQDTFKEQEEMFDDFRKALGLPDLVPGSDNEIPGYPHILEAIHALQGHLDKAEAVVRAAEAVVGFWGSGDMEHEYPRGQLKELREAVAAFRGRA